MSTDPSSCHPLKHNWTIWFHHIDSEDWGASSYRKLGTFGSVEDFWSYINNMEELVLSGDMLVLMKEPMIPVWEEEGNRNGGTIRFFRIIDDIYEVFQNLCMGLVGRTLFSDDSQIDWINGFSVVRKNDSCVFKLWTSQVVDPPTLKWNPEYQIGNLNGMQFKLHFEPPPHPRQDTKARAPYNRNSRPNHGRQEPNYDRKDHDRKDQKNRKQKVITDDDGWSTKTH